MTKFMTPRKAAILEMLEADYDEHGRDNPMVSEFGRPPFAATDIATYIDWFGGENGRPEIKWTQRPDGTKTTSDPNAWWSPPASTVQSFARTLRGMAEEGLLVQVREKMDTRNGLARSTCEMPRTAYWSARTYERDLRLLQAYRATMEATYGWTPKKFERFMGTVEDIGAPKLQMIVSPANDTEIIDV
jgi:hypothetical protein